MPSVAFVSGGRLHVVADGRPPRRFDSAFAATVRDRTHEIHRRHSWKGEGSQGGFGAIAWGRQPTGAPSVSATVAGLTRGCEPGLLMYALDVDRLTAVCTLDPRTGDERRLLHGSKTRLRDLCARGDREEIACAMVHADGTASIALMRPDATDLRQVTEGDSLDLFPSWADDGTPRIVYQAAGLGRDAAGRPASFGRFAIHVLDLARGEVETLATEDGADLEQPRIGTDGALHYLRRPGAAARASVGRVLWDALLLPVRLLYALFQYLNFFSARYTGKPLTTAGGPRRQAGDLRRMLEWANLVDAQGGGDASAEETGGVPRSHRLVRQRPGASPEILAHGVACYDLGPDGDIAYATGAAIFHRHADGRVERLCDVTGVNAVVLLPEPTP
jgi:hypothetical protein